MVTTEKKLDIKSPPHSLEAEQAVLGGLMLDKGAFDKITRLASEHFYRPEHKQIFETISELVAKDRAIDVITVSEALEQKAKLASVGGLTYLGELANNTPSAANITAYSDIVYERYIFRQLIEIGANISDIAFHPNGLSSTEVLDKVERDVFDIAEKGTRGSGPENIKKVVARTLDKIEARFNDNSPITGLPTGYSDLDNITSGLQNGDLVIIAGRPSMGKTGLAMNIAENVAIRSNKNVLIFSMEMPAEALAMRMLSSLGRIDQTRLRSGRLADEDWTRLTNAVGLLSQANLVIDETPGLTPIELRARARRVAREGKELGLIVIDYLQLMRVPGLSDNRTAEISEISRSLKGLAKELSVPVIALSQLNRGLEQRPNKRPIMSDLRESGAIEQDADLIGFIYRDEVYNEDSPHKGIAEFIIGKQRNGPIGTVRMAFLGQYIRFENFIHEQSFTTD